MSRTRLAQSISTSHQAIIHHPSASFTTSTLCNSPHTAPSLMGRSDLTALPPNRPSQRRRDGCSECRRKKVKCDLRKPVCSRCTRYPRGCVYTLSIIGSNRRPAGPAPEPRPARATNKLDPTLGLSMLTHQPTLTPSPYLSSTESKFFMHILATQTAPVFFPAAPKLFLDGLISSALDTPHLLAALLASACSHHGRLVGGDTQRSRMACLKFTNRAISGLGAALMEPEQMLRPETAMTAMTLCTNDVCNGNMQVWRTHLTGVMRLLTALVEQSNTRDPLTTCLVKWFTAMDVLAGMSGSAGPSDHGLLNPFPQTGHSQVDDICGYSLSLVPALTRIGHLARRTQAPSLDILLEAQHHSPNTADTHGPTLALELQHTHLAFVHCALLHLHRRVQHLPRHHPTVRADLLHILTAIQNIRPFSQTNILILWPVFSAGCETTEPSERRLIHARMTNMRRLGMGNFTRARDMLEAFWAAESALPWDLYFIQQGVELVLF
ncbi:hypothetical protein BO70DRAFT_388967 [Aspergillus heteromorphus CBS 117.55]|uniref:Zn(2)-C6 fungal-type domain-containing protein n=1 Tax=Aspergillus heteromorphus CBS 117.55 TaxID=1448321 RepID=A0A317VIW4_9EURO|nr:uncharacterized protein BO70DRAFT_388967 [Aspergillus heteromorphus CBS 117.55]PWY74324.1 hypothetical protein BO70DRAFT_388967 [Aspergillus heteromorphus CBS 117.55]